MGKQYHLIWIMMQFRCEKSVNKINELIRLEVFYLFFLSASCLVRH